MAQRGPCHGRRRDVACWTTHDTRRWRVNPGLMSPWLTTVQNAGRRSHGNHWNLVSPSAMIAQNGPFEQQCIPFYISNRSIQRKIWISLPLKIRRLSYLCFLQPLKRAKRSIGLGHDCSSETSLRAVPKTCVFGTTSPIPKTTLFCDSALLSHHHTFGLH